MIMTFSNPSRIRHATLIRPSSAPSPCHRRSPRAFTLIELLLAIALTVIVASLLGASLYTAFHAKKSIDESLEATRTMDIAADTLSQELANSLPPSPITTTTITGLDSSMNGTSGILVGPFEGLVDSVDFFTSGPEPKADLQPDVREIQYALVPDPQNSGSKMLVRRVTTNLLAPVITQAPDEIVAKNVVNFALSYYDGSSWYDVWDSTQQVNGLPVAVQFQLELAPRTAKENSRIDLRTVPLTCATAASVTGGGQ